MTREGPIRPEMYLGEMLRRYPAVRNKAKEFFGEECIRCKSNRLETIHYTSWHRGLDPAKVCRALNALLKG